MKLKKIESYLPQKPKLVPITVKIPPGLKEEIDALLEEKKAKKKMSLTSLVVACLSAYVEQEKKAG